MTCGTTSWTTTPIPCHPKWTIHIFSDMSATLCQVKIFNSTLGDSVHTKIRIFEIKQEYYYVHTNTGIIIVYSNNQLSEFFKYLNKCPYIFCLFVCLGFFVPLENFSLIWRRHYCR